jgi:hypothetical protein
MDSNKRPSSAAVQVTTSLRTTQHFAPLALSLKISPSHGLLLLSRARVTGGCSTLPRDLPWLQLLCRSNFEEMTTWPSPSGSTTRRWPSAAAAMDKGGRRGWGASRGGRCSAWGLYKCVLRHATSSRATRLKIVLLQAPIPLLTPLTHGGRAVAGRFGHLRALSIGLGDPRPGRDRARGRSPGSSRG